ncbi:MAG TPA: VanZ family protein [Terriglobales bacterium]|nr:VanZ family protein [Terriglobales bacterium]
MKVFTRNFRYWLPVLFWLGVIAYESFRLSSNVTGNWLWHLFRILNIHISRPAFSELHHFLRKAGHVTGYGIFCLLLFRAWFHSVQPFDVRSTQTETASAQQLRGVHVRCAALAIAMTFMTAVLDEWHQAFDITRTSSPWDVTLDVTGGVTFLAFALFVLRLWRDMPRQLDPASV